MVMSLSRSMGLWRWFRRLVRAKRGIGAVAQPELLPNEVVTKSLEIVAKFVFIPTVISAQSRCWNDHDDPTEIVLNWIKHCWPKQCQKSVAIALRNRWRRTQVAEPLRREITPKNILMIGPTGVGKTEIARRLARLANAPFIKIRGNQVLRSGLRRP